MGGWVAVEGGAGILEVNIEMPARRYRAVEGLGFDILKAGTKEFVANINEVDIVEIIEMPANRLADLEEVVVGGIGGRDIGHRVVASPFVRAIEDVDSR